MQVIKLRLFSFRRNAYSNKQVVSRIHSESYARSGGDFLRIFGAKLEICKHHAIAMQVRPRIAVAGVNQVALAGVSYRRRISNYASNSSMETS